LTIFVTLVGFEELTHGQWGLIVPSIPPHAHTGRDRTNDRRTVNGILYVLMSGTWLRNDTNKTF